MSKQEQEIMEILEAYDLTRSAWSAAELADCDPKTVQRYVQLRDAGKDVFARTVRPKLVDQFADKIEELVERSHGKVRADVVHDKLLAMGFEGNERTTRPAVERTKTAHRQGKRRSSHFSGPSTARRRRYRPNAWWCRLQTSSVERQLPTSFPAMETQFAEVEIP